MPLTGDHIAEREVTILVLDDCPHRDLAVARVAHAARNLGATVLLECPEVRVLARRDALAAGLHGSPTILIDGSDPFPFTGDGTAACRLYPTGCGLESAPSVEQLEEVLRGDPAALTIRQEASGRVHSDRIG